MKNKPLIRMLLFVSIIVAGLLIFFVVIDLEQLKTLQIANEEYRNNAWIEYLSRADQQSDEILEITIEKNFSECLTIGQQAKINYKIRNISRHSIFINSEFQISPSKISISGNMLPVFFTKDLRIIFLPVDLFDPGFENPMEIHEGIKLEPSEVYQGEVSLTVPEQIVDNSPVGIKNIALKDGIYFVKIIYSNIEEMDNFWKGKISSNLIEICVKK